MKEHQLKALVQVAECSSIRAAARAMNLSQSALTKALRELEEAVGAELLSRRLARTTRAGDHGQLTRANVEVEVFEVVLAGAADSDLALGHGDSLEAEAKHSRGPSQRLCAKGFQVKT